MTRTVLCYGDSNTHGTPPMAHFGASGRFDRQTRWPGQMASALGQDWDVIEEGHPGRTTVHPDPYDGAHKNGAMILPAVLDSHRPLDAVVILLGTNDLKSIFNAGPQDVALSLEALVRIIKTRDCGPKQAMPKVLLVCPPPVIETGIFAEMFRGAAEKSARLPMEIAAAAERSGVAWMDAGQVISADPQEGVHFNAAAHAALGKAIAAEVVGLFS